MTRRILAGGVVGVPYGFRYRDGVTHARHGCADPFSRGRERYCDQRLRPPQIACAPELVPCAPMRIGPRGRVDHPGLKSPAFPGW